MSNQFEKKTGFVAGFKHIFEACSYSLSGLRAGWRLSLAFRQECAVFLFLCFLLYFFDKPLTTWFISLFMWLIVLSLELINSAIEESVDLISKDYSPVIKDIKDMGSAAVFLFTMFNLVAQSFIFFDDIKALFI